MGEVKIIIILRNPVDRAHSAWKMYSSFAKNPFEHLRKLYDGRTFTDAIIQEVNHEKLPSNYLYYYVDRGKYIYQIDNYMKEFSEDGLLILDFDDFEHNLKFMLDSTCDFLEIDRFNSAALSSLSKQKHNVNKRNFILNNSDHKTLDFLKSYFTPYNRKLFDFLGYSFDWF